jgi:hypothetical protein
MMNYWKPYQNMGEIKKGKEDLVIRIHSINLENFPQPWGFSGFKEFIISLYVCNWNIFYLTCYFSNTK